MTRWHPSQWLAFLAVSALSARLILGGQPVTGPDSAPCCQCPTDQ